MKNMIKKISAVLAISCMVCGLLISAGCGNKKEDDRASSGSASASSAAAEETLVNTVSEPEKEPVPDDSSEPAGALGAALVLGSAEKSGPAAVSLPVMAEAAVLLSGTEDEPEPAYSGDDIMHEQEFGGVYIAITIDDFNALGFEYGDSVDIAFSSGYTLEDIPYYNGYYTNNGEPLLVAYPGYPYIKAAINNSDDLWTVAGLSEDDSADIALRERGKYLDIQNARDIHYKDDRDQFPSDEAFANFRYVQAGNIAPVTLYRSASPCDNQHNRAPYVDDLIEAAGVNCIINLADTDAKIQGYIAREGFDSPYFLSLHEQGNVILLGLNMNYSSDEFRQKVKNGLLEMLEHQGPYLVHCTEGKDRTGFVCMLLEALCGASYEEIRDDYMITYDNYYEITPEKDAARYEVIVDKVLDPMIQSITGPDDVDIRTADLSKYAAALLSDAGMSEEEIRALKEALASGQ